MLVNAFIGHIQQPTDSEVDTQLGAAKPLWDELLSALASDYHLDQREWTSYSPKAGWALKLKYRQRNILYLAPCRGCFQASLILGDRGVNAARQALPSRAVKLIDHAKRYPEGTGIRIEVKRPSDLQFVKTLVKVKLEN